MHIDEDRMLTRLQRARRRRVLHRLGFRLGLGLWLEPVQNFGPFLPRKLQIAESKHLPEGKISVAKVVQCASCAGIAIYEMDDVGHSSAGAN